MNRRLIKLQRDQPAFFMNGSTAYWIDETPKLKAPASAES
jgi:hypothetical protein